MSRGLEELLETARTLDYLRQKASDPDPKIRQAAALVLESVQQQILASRRRKRAARRAPARPARAA